MLEEKAKTPDTFRTRKLEDLLDYQDAKAAQQHRVADYLQGNGSASAAKKMRNQADGAREVIIDLRKEFQLPDEIFNALVKLTPDLPKQTPTE